MRQRSWNSHQANPLEMQSILQDDFEYLADGSGKRTFPLQTTAKSRVQCGIRQGLRDKGNEAYTPVLQYRCRCSPGYKEDGQGVCQLFWGIGRVTGLVLGVTTLVVLTTMAATLTCIRLRQSHVRLAFDPDLHKGLLEESESGVVALKRAWEIDWADVDLTRCIDQASEGAFGEVRCILDIADIGAFIWLPVGD